MGIGQKVPSDVTMSEQQWRQSSLTMKPSSGVYAPIASMNRSETSRLVNGTLVSEWARLVSSALSIRGTSSGFSVPPPCGGTSVDMEGCLSIDGFIREPNIRSSLAVQCRNGRQAIYR